MDRDTNFGPGDVVAGSYVVERELGSGGTGVVALARHLQHGHRVALKYLRSSRDVKLVQRFEREGQIGARLSSDHVARVYDVGSLEGDVRFIAMEYLEGEDLGAIVARGAVPIDRAAAWTIDACIGLAEAHAQGIVHRDIKPANLFLAQRPDGRSVVKVLDFGLSKVAEGPPSLRPGMTRPNESFGTPHYMSPEQLISSTNVDGRADVWSLGVVLYELLTGRLPFESDDLRQLIADVLSSEPRPIRELRPDVPAELAAVVHACLSYDRNARPVDVMTLATRLRPFAAGPRPPQLLVGVVAAASFVIGAALVVAMS